MITAEEVHNSRLWAAILAAPGLVMLAMAATPSLLFVRIVLAFSGIVTVAAGIMAWSGFHYVFNDAGVEIRTLGYRVRKVLASDIRNYGRAGALRAATVFAGWALPRHLYGAITACVSTPEKDRSSWEATVRRG